MNADELSVVLARHREWIEVGMPLGDPRRADLSEYVQREIERREKGSER